MSILDILATKGVITPDDAKAFKEEAETSNESIEKVLSKHGVTNQAIVESKGEYLDIPVRTIDTNGIKGQILHYIPEESARHYKIVPIGLADDVLEVGIVDPDNIEARDALNFISAKINIPFKIFLITEQDFDKVIALYKGLSEEVNEALSELETQNSKFDKELSLDDAESGGDAISAKDGKIDTKIIEDAPVTKIVATILRYATDGTASDIHVEPMRETIRVRFRVDGILNTSLVLPIKVHSAVVARIKILSNMRLDEKRKPQDGRFSAKIEGRKIDFRVSTFPTYFGEKIVMRILDHDKGVRPLDQIGISDRNIATIRKALQRPYGLILISGPTGSGKTTTLYSMLGEIDRDKLNVLSLEDPIEYNIEGVSQSQVRPDIGYTFANGLRTTLRQDPDVIMVGEIRDKVTARLAIQAALTGHLVFSTIHTNSAIGVIPRLVDMGVDPYLIAPTLVLAIAQRLVSALCPGAGKPMPIEGSLKIMLDKQFEDLPDEFQSLVPKVSEVYEASPTDECPKGTHGRMAVMEVLEMDRELEAVILKDPTELAIGKLARSKGMLSMKEDAIIKAMNKEIPFEEVNGL
ncbi:MAG TPA: GspE/PulE family protein [Candidatus Paceibacterota bacterium]|nr:GspE/PulE family protein [Candidatus Paceibacterota bacterium]